MAKINQDMTILKISKFSSINNYLIYRIKVVKLLYRASKRHMKESFVTKTNKVMNIRITAVAWGGLMHHLLIYLSAGAFRMAALTHCYHSIAPCIRKVGISASAICLEHEVGDIKTNGNIDKIYLLYSSIVLDLREECFQPIWSRSTGRSLLLTTASNNENLQYY